MDFGVVGGMDMDCLMGPEPGEGATAHSHVSGPETKPGHGSGLSSKQQRSWPVEDDWRVSKPDDMSSPRTMPLPQGPPPQLLMRSSSLAPPRQEQMLSFASNKSEVTFLSKDGGASSDFAYYQRMPTPSSPYARNAGYGSGSLNANMHGLYAAAKGPFTPSQWIELEHQALIYKYLNANAPVPSNLLIPLKKALYPYGLSGPSPNSLGWGSFHLGYSGNADPEPGRCRRTDGKKWRCSRDAVADQKYCERHINRGRHRSRKPVEGQTGHGASRRANSKEVAPPVTSSMPTSVGGASQPQFKSLEPPPADAAAANSSVDAFANRMQDPQGLSVMSASSIKPESNASSFNIPKRDFPMEESSQSEFGLVSTDSLLNPSHRSSFIPKDFGGSFLDFTDQETQDQNLLHQFIDDWPKDQSSQSVVTWPEDLKSDWTQLSMAIPMASDFSSSSSSPTQDKLGLSPLRLSREFEPTQNLGVSNDQSEPRDQQTNWVPISWRSSMGGPLGEVLTNTSSCVNSKNSSSSNTSPINLLNEGWDGSSQLESSPTGVLQKSTFCSLSNSSSGSSPRADNKKSRDGASLYDDVLGSTLASSSVPSL